MIKNKLKEQTYCLISYTEQRYIPVTLSFSLSAPYLGIYQIEIAGPESDYFINAMKAKGFGSLSLLYPDNYEKAEKVLHNLILNSGYFCVGDFFNPYNLNHLKDYKKYPRVKDFIQFLL